MPRPPRYPLIGVPQHVIQRGNNRQPTFFTQDNFRFYRDCLTEAATYDHCEIHAYVLMTNHMHLLSRRVRPAKAGRPKTKVESKAEIPV